ncbi:MAG: hypothetical protein ABEJ61_08950 [Haloferacaceae archaeon]
MQRRAAAIYVAIFLLIGGASYALVATAERPHVQFSDPEQRLAQGDQFTVDGRQYTVASVTAESSGGGGGHGGGGGVTHAATLEWTNESARYTRTWGHNTTVTVGGEQRRVVVPNESDPSSFALETVQNRSAILQSDPNADNETVTRNGREYVVVTENETSRLVPASEYFPEPERTRYTEGQQFDYGGNRTTVGNVTAGTVPITWNAPRTNPVELSNEANVTLNGQQYFVYFPDNSTVLLEADYGVYERQVQAIEEFDQTRNGLRGVAMLSGFVVVLLTGMAYLPSRY